jgi:hypothetical protein
MAGARGEHSIRLAGQAVRGVAFGVVVTAVVLSVPGGIGLAVAGVPFTAVLTAVMFMLAIAKVGPLLVLIPSVAWLYWSSQTGWAVFSSFLDPGNRSHGQFFAPDFDLEKSRSPTVAHFRQRGRRFGCLRSHRHLRWADSARRGPQAPNRLGR